MQRLLPAAMVVAATTLVFCVVIIAPLYSFSLVPLVDIVAYSHLNAAPPAMHAGPDHFYTFELTYILHYAIARLDRGLAAVHYDHP